MGCFPCKRIAELEREVMEKEEEKKSLINDNTDVIEQLIQALEEQGRKLEAFSKCSTQIMKESGSQENTNDEFSNTRLAERFASSMKSQWLDICFELRFTLTEIEYLTTLSGIMETISQHTVRMVNDTERNLVQLAQFANEDQTEVRHTIRVLRQRLGQKKSTLDTVVKDIVAKVKEEEIVRSLLTHHNVPDATVATLETFIYDLAKICWLMCIGNPPLKLNFDVEGVDFNNINNRFVEYAIYEKEIFNGKPGAVYLVAWPSLELEDNAGFLMKGEAIVCKKTITV